MLEIKAKFADPRRTTLEASAEEIDIEDLIKEEDCVITLTHFGYIKRLPVDTYKSQKRGGKGVKCYKIMEKTGEVIGAKAVNEENEIMLITNEGIIIRMAVSDISVLGRITSGVKLIDIDVEKEIRVAGLTKVKDTVPMEQETSLKEK